MRRLVREARCGFASPDRQVSYRGRIQESISDFGLSVNKLSPSGNSYTFSVIHTFNSTGGSFGGMIFFDNEGTMFGTTGGGGNVNPLCGSGCGVVFKLFPSGSGWTETVLYKFTGGADGQAPYPLVMDAAGNLFGTALFGGLPICQPLGCGTAFELSSTNGGYMKSLILETYNDVARSLANCGPIVGVNQTGMPDPQMTGIPLMSDRLNVLSLPALWAFGHVELHPLSFLKASETACLYRGEVHV